MGFPCHLSRLGKLFSPYFPLFSGVYWFLTPFHVYLSSISQIIYFPSVRSSFMAHLAISYHLKFLWCSKLVWLLCILRWLSNFPPIQFWYALLQRRFSIRGISFSSGLAFLLSSIGSDILSIRVLCVIMSPYYPSKCYLDIKLLAEGFLFISEVSFWKRFGSGSYLGLLIGRRLWDDSGGVHKHVRWEGYFQISFHEQVEERVPLRSLLQCVETGLDDFCSGGRRVWGIRCWISRGRRWSRRGRFASRGGGLGVHGWRRRPSWRHINRCGLVPMWHLRALVASLICPVLTTWASRV